MEPLRNLRRIDGRSVAATEDQVVVLPARAELKPCLYLQSPVLSQDCAGTNREVDSPSAEYPIDGLTSGPPSAFPAPASRLQINVPDVSSSCGAPEARMGASARIEASPFHLSSRDIDINVMTRRSPADDKSETVPVAWRKRE